MTKRVAIIGGGPAGLTAAYSLTKSTPTVDVYEASDAVGGLARSLELWGQTVDLGPHRFFSRDRRINSLWLEVMGRDYVMVPRQTRILHRGHFFNYPLQPLDALKNLGLLEAVRCAASWGQAKLTPATGGGESFEEWVTSRFGSRLYRHFFKSYSEKLWGIPCAELDADFAAQRIRSFSLGAALRRALRFGGNQHRTLVEEFAYPLAGTGVVYQRMAAAIENRGGSVLTNTPVQRVLASNGRVYGIELPDGEVRQYDSVISSMPITALIARLDEAPQAIQEAAGKLTFRNTILVYLEVASDTVCPDNWLYVQDETLLTGRITNFRNWSPQLYGVSPHTILVMEYWCNEADELWRRPNGDLIELAKHELTATTLVPDISQVRNGHVVRIPKSYPVYRRGYREILAPIQRYLESIGGLEVIGRYGAFKYNNQDHSMLMGLLAAENVLERRFSDLWKVNCDYDTYQEGSRISETGLVSTS